MHSRMSGTQSGYQSSRRREQSAAPRGIKGTHEESMKVKDYENSGIIEDNKDKEQAERLKLEIKKNRETKTDIQKKFENWERKVYPASQRD